MYSPTIEMVYNSCCHVLGSCLYPYWCCMCWFVIGSEMMYIQISDSTWLAHYAMYIPCYTLHVPELIMYISCICLIAFRLSISWDRWNMSVDFSENSVSIYEVACCYTQALLIISKLYAVWSQQQDLLQPSLPVHSIYTLCSTSM